MHRVVTYEFNKYYFIKIFFEIKLCLNKLLTELKRCTNHGWVQQFHKTQNYERNYFQTCILVKGVLISSQRRSGVQRPQRLKTDPL